MKADSSRIQTKRPTRASALLRISADGEEHGERFRKGGCLVGKGDSSLDGELFVEKESPIEAISSLEEDHSVRNGLFR